MTKRFGLIWVAPGEFATADGAWLAIREYSLKYGCNVWYVSGPDRKCGYGWARTLEGAAAMIAELPQDGAE